MSRELRDYGVALVVSLTALAAALYWAATL